jgi:phosphatidate cytidylyltransferase
MLASRVATAAVLIAILFPALCFGGVPAIALIVAFFSAMAVWELTGNLPSLKPSLNRLLTLGLGLVAIMAFYRLSERALFAVVVWLPLLVMLLHLFLYDHIENTVESAVHMTFVVGYAVISLCHAILLGRLDPSNVWVFFVLVVVCLSDAGAYFAGRYYGKRRFSKRVSPSKTVEGLAGGLVAALVGMAVIKVIAPWLPSLWTLVPLALLLVVADVLGDLCASAIKRRLKIKDFGVMLPGHGGVMDRADGLILAFPVAYHFLALSGFGLPS